MKDSRLGASLDKLLAGPTLRKKSSTSTLASQRRPSTPASDTRPFAKPIELGAGPSTPTSASAMYHQPSIPPEQQPCGLASPASDEAFVFNPTSVDPAASSFFEWDPLTTRARLSSASSSSARNGSTSGGSGSGSSTPRRRGAIKTLWRKCTSSKEYGDDGSSPSRRPSNASSDATIETPAGTRFTCSTVDVPSDPDFFSPSISASAFYQAPLSPKTRLKALADEDSSTTPMEPRSRHGSLPSAKARPATAPERGRKSDPPGRIPHPLASPSTQFSATDIAAPCFRNPFNPSSGKMKKPSSRPATPTTNAAPRVRFIEDTKPSSPRLRSASDGDCGCWPSSAASSSSGPHHICSSPDPFQRQRTSTGIFSASRPLAPGERPSLAWAPKPMPPSPHIFEVPEEAEWLGFDRSDGEGGLGLGFGDDDDDDDRLSCAFSDDSDTDAPSSVSSGMPATPRTPRTLAPSLPPDPFAALPIVPMRLTSRSLLDNSAPASKPCFSPLTPSSSATSGSNSSATAITCDSDADSIATAATSISGSGASVLSKPFSVAAGPPSLPSIRISSLPSTFDGLSL